MIYIAQNIGQILAATAAGLVIGALYLALTRAPKPGPGLVLAAVVAEFWLCAILAGALILAPKQAPAWTMALGSAFIIWVGFVLPALVVTLRHRQQPAGAVAGDCAHWLAVMLVQAATLQAIGLTAPPA